MWRYVFLTLLLVATSQGGIELSLGWGSILCKTTESGPSILASNAIKDYVEKSSTKSSITLVNLSNCTLSNIEPGAFLLMTAFNSKINVSGNFLKSLKNATFTGATGVVQVDLSYNLLESIDGDAFEGLTSLHTMNLRCNMLLQSDYAMPLFGGLLALEYLDLSRNNRIRTLVEDFEDGTKDTYSNLVEYYYSGRHTKKNDILDNLLRYKTTVRSLDLSHNRLESLPAGLLEEFFNLHEIDLSFNSLTQIYKKFFQNNANLDEIRLNNNKLINFDFQESLSYKNVTKIDMSYNSLEGFAHRSFRTLTSLIYVKLDHNLIRTLPEKFFEGNQQLRRIMLNDNKIYYLKSGVFEGCDSLEGLYLQNNALQTLVPNLLRDLINLDTLELSNNGIVDIPENFFTTNTKLRFLDLSKNSISNIKAKVLEPLVNLRYLHLEFNGLLSISSRLFVKSPELNRLLLQGNRLTFIDPELLYLPNLSRINVACNEIQKLPKDTFAKSEIERRTIHLHGNPFDCYCLTKAMEKYNEFDSSVKHDPKKFSDGRYPFCIAGEEASDCDDLLYLNDTIRDNWYRRINFTEEFCN